MKEMQFSVDISASKEKVWDILWRDETFRQWAGLIDPDTYMVGELIEGNTVQFISGDSGYGVTSLVEKVTPCEYLLLRHSADTQDEGQRERDDQWTGGAEIYTLTENNDVTTLTIQFDSPAELVDIMNENYPKAMTKIKELAES
jgi:uncharacterized protein YndB with AHSA1/START domain